MPDSGKRYLQSMFDYTIEKGLKFFHTHKKFQCVPAPDLCIVSCLCHILSAFFDFMSRYGGFGNPGMFNKRSSVIWVCPVCLGLLCVPAPDLCIVSCLCLILSAFFDFMSRYGGFGNPGMFNKRSSVIWVCPVCLGLLCVPAPDLCIVSCLCLILSAFFDFMSRYGGFGNPGMFNKRSSVIWVCPVCLGLLCVPAPDLCIVSCLCHILSAFFDFMSRYGGFGNPGRFLFVLFCCFTSQVNSYGHGKTVSSSNHTFSWASLSLNKRITSNSCTYLVL